MFICMILASAFFVIFAFLFLTAGDNLAKALIVCNVEIQTETIKKTQIEMNLLAGQIQKIGQQEKKKLKKHWKKNMAKNLRCSLLIIRVCFRIIILQKPMPLHIRKYHFQQL